MSRPNDDAPIGIRSGHVAAPSRAADAPLAVPARGAPGRTEVRYFRFGGLPGGGDLAADPARPEGSDAEASHRPKPAPGIAWAPDRLTARSSDPQGQHAALDLPSPPTWAKRFRSDDLDEIAEFISGFLDQRARVTHGAGGVGFDQSTVTGTSIQVAWMRTDLSMTVRGAVREPVLHLAVPKGTEYRFGRRRWTAGGGSMTFVPPGWEYTRIRPPGSVLALSIDRRRLAEEAEARLPGRRGDLLLRARSISLLSAEHALVLAAAEDFMYATEPGAGPSILARAEARFIDALAGLLLEESATSRGQEVATSRLVNLEAWIEAHLEEPISVGRLCNLAGVGERALQKAFESRRGMSPLRFVTERRLAVARRSLSRPDRCEDVTQIAHRLGFAHTGRFAAVYRQVFGESPSATLRRAAR